MVVNGLGYIHALCKLLSYRLTASTQWLLTVNQRESCAKSDGCGMLSSVQTELGRSAAVGRGAEISALSFSHNGKMSH